MRTHFTRPRYLVLCCLCVLIAAAVVGVRATRHRRQQRELPPVVSKVKDIEVVSAVIREPEGDAPFVEIVLWNNSARSVIAVAVESGDEHDASGIITGDFRGDDEPPNVIIEPYGSKTMTMLVSNLLPGKPLKVSGAMFADGGEDGEEITLKSMRDFRNRENAAKNAAKKGGTPR